jgi:hypothetical protein
MEFWKVTALKCDGTIIRCDGTHLPSAHTVAFQAAGYGRLLTLATPVLLNRGASQRLQSPPCLFVSA